MTSPTSNASSKLNYSYFSNEEKSPVVYSPIQSLAAASLASPCTFYFWEKKAAIQINKPVPPYFLKAALGSTPIIICPLATQHYFKSAANNSNKERTSALEQLKDSATAALISVPFIDIFNRYSGGQRGWNLLQKPSLASYSCIFFSELSFLSSVALHPWIEYHVHKKYGDNPLAHAVAKAANGAFLTLCFHPFDTAALCYTFGARVEWKKPSSLFRGIHWNILAVATFNIQVEVLERLLKNQLK